MRFNEGLQVRLQERYRRLYKANWQSYRSHAKYLVDWLSKQPALVSILDAVDRSEPEFDPETWLNSQEHRFVRYPENETAFAKLAWWLLRARIAKTESVGSGIPDALSGNSRNLNDQVRDFTSEVIEPLIEYLQERLASETDVLYTLERYRRRVLWFERQRLRKQYQNDRIHGEDNLDRDLRKFLFDQGIDYPFSQPASSSGKADIVANLESDDPLVCEVKLFDDISYNAAYLAKGLNQAVRYAEDYGKDEAYLVIFNLAERRLELPTDDADYGWPPRLHTAGKTVFLIDVQVAPLPSASQQRARQPIAVSRDDLLP